MRKNGRVLLILLVSALSACGQPGMKNQDLSMTRRKNDSVCALVKRFFNARLVDSLYALTGESFRKQINPDMFRNISNSNLFPLGQIKETDFLKDADKVSFYKAVFSTDTLELMIGLDSVDKLQTFAFVPYKDGNARKTGPVASTNLLATVQDKVVDSIALGYLRRLPPVGLSIGILRDRKTCSYGDGETAKNGGLGEDVEGTAPNSQIIDPLGFG